jgi:hypothetical protein
MRFCFRSLFYVYFSCHFSAFNGANIDRPKCLCPHRHRWIDVLPRFSWLLRCNSRVTMSFVSGKFTQKILKFSTMTMVISFVIEINLQTTQLDWIHYYFLTLNNITFSVIFSSSIAQIVTSFLRETFYFFFLRINLFTYTKYFLIQYFPFSVWCLHHYSFGS